VTNQLRFEGYAVAAFTAPTSDARLCKRRGRQVNEPLPTVPVTPFSGGIDPMTDNEQVIAQAIARAFETLSDRLSKELDDALNQMAQLNGVGAETAIRNHVPLW
jgi:hypothetical protein